MLATRHRKAEAIAPALAPLGLTVVATEAVDTDALGTFTGTVPRAGSMRDAARAKAVAGLVAVPDAAFAIASEGAFGPHPEAPWVSTDLELLLLRDRDGTFEIVLEHLSLEARALARVVRSVEQGLEAARDAGVPSHGVVVRDGADLQTQAPPRATLVRELAEVEAHVAAAIAASGAAVIANDLRAHANPTRMAAIGAAAALLADRLNVRCPACTRPGWHARPQPGLPCAVCGTPTGIPGADAWQCDGCGHRDVRLRSGTADPARCPQCNP